MPLHDAELFFRKPFSLFFVSWPERLDFWGVKLSTPRDTTLQDNDCLYHNKNKSSTLLLWSFSLSVCPSLYLGIINIALS